jgi:hypothetical protein
MESRTKLRSYAAQEEADSLHAEVQVDVTPIAVEVCNQEEETLVLPCGQDTDFSENVGEGQGPTTGSHNANNNCRFTVVRENGIHFF